jgi:hypothetical protein
MIGPKQLTAIKKIQSIRSHKSKFIKNALSIYQNLSHQEPWVLLHGDLHHDNIISQDKILLIDPKGLWVRQYMSLGPGFVISLKKQKTKISPKLPKKDNSIPTILNFLIKIWLIGLLLN